MTAGPQDLIAGGSGAAGSGAAAAGSAGPQPTKVIELSCMDDGTYQVEVESGPDEAAEGTQGEGAGEANTQSYKSLDEAMQAIQQAAGGEDEDPQEMWDQEASKRPPGAGTATGGM